MNRIFAFGDREILARETETGVFIFPLINEVKIKDNASFFVLGGDKAINIESLEGNPKGFEMKPLREVLAKVISEEYGKLSKGAELVDWDATMKFCSRDGGRLIRHSEISKICEKCGHEYFPYLSPAIVVLVKKEDKALLVHAKNLRKDIMALVAGFVETGESLEECVKREVKEETNLEIKNIRYIGSQAWPFPNQLMTGFVADYESGKIKYNDGEVERADFFDRQHLPLIPTPPSLTRKIIDMWVKGEL